MKYGTKSNNLIFYRKPLDYFSMSFTKAFTYGTTYLDKVVWDLDTIIFQMTMNHLLGGYPCSLFLWDKGANNFGKMDFNRDSMVNTITN